MNFGIPSTGEHPDVEQLHAYAKGLLDDDQLRHELEAHLRICDQCLAEIERADSDQFEERIRSLLDNEKFNSPPSQRYELIEEIGRGGAGVVYRAKQAGLDREIALKMLLRGDRSSRAEFSRFRRESVALARLSHANIVQIYDCGELDGAPYLAMEFVDGITLAERLRVGPIDTQLAARWLLALAEAIAQVHEKGILHRDLKPQNVLLARPEQGGEQALSRQKSNEGEAQSQQRYSLKDPFANDKCLSAPQNTKGDTRWTPKLVDFGLAACQDSTVFHTASGETLGTPAYMAPETIGGRSKTTGGELLDIYGLGAILYECLTGRPPFTGSSTWEILEAVANRDPVSISSLRSGVPRDLITICNRCLDKRADRRFRSARDLADDLQRFLNGEPIQSRRVSSVERTWRWAKRRPATAVACLLGLTLATSIPFLLAYQNWSVQKERNLARDQYVAVRATLHDVLAELNRNTGTVVPEATQLAARQVSHARKLFEQLAEVDRSPQSDFDLGKVLIQSAIIENLLGNNEQAVSFLDQAEARFDRHQKHDPSCVEALQGLLKCQIARAKLLQEFNELDLSERHLAIAAEIFASLENLHRESGAPSETDLLGENQLLLETRGTLALQQNKYKEAADLYQRSINVLQQLAERQGEGPDHLLAAAGLKVNLAAVLMQMHRNEEAEMWYQQALEAFEEWGNNNARTSKWVEDWATAILNRSNLLAALNRHDEAFETLDQARPILRQAIKTDPGRVELQRLLFMISANRGLFCSDQSRKIEVWRDAVGDAIEQGHQTYARHILVRVMANKGEPLEAYTELTLIDQFKLTPQELFVHASCLALIGKNFSENANTSEPDQNGARAQESLQESWRLLRLLAEQNELTEARIEHLANSSDWSTIRQLVGELEWSKFLSRQLP